MNLEDKNVKTILENEVISTLLENPNYFGQTIHHLKQEYFGDLGSGLLFKTIKNHYLEFNKIPTLKDIILSHKTSDTKTKEIVKNSIKEINSSIEPVHIDLLIQQTELFIKDAIFTNALILGAGIRTAKKHTRFIEK